MATKISGAIKTFPFYAVLFALYPVITLYARLPGGVQPSTTLRVILLQTLLVAILFLVIYRFNKNTLRAGFIAGLVVFYFSSTGHLYSVLQSLQIPTWSHLAIVVFGLFIIATMSHRLVWEKYLTSARLTTITSYLNLIAVFSLVYPAYQISGVLWDARDDAVVPWNQLIRQNIPMQTVVAEDLPDIYYIILDGYGRNDSVQDVFGYDNSDFIRSLEERGFYVADESRSNYIRTVASLSSSLNMDYINFAKDKAGWDSINYLPLYDLIHHSLVRSMLEESGYRTVTVATDFGLTDIKDSDIYLSPFKSDLAEFERVYLGNTALGAFYDPEFGFTDTLRKYLPLPGYGTHRALIHYQYAQLARIPMIEGPKFVFVHIISPHPPFVFDADGNALTTDRSYTLGDGEGFLGTPEEYRNGYIGQLQYVNKMILQAIDAILASSTSPVIILQGDHGSGSLLDEKSMKDSCMYERTSILNAYYMPDGRTQSLYPSITPVNTFRILFNTYLGTDFSPLPDRTYYSPWINPYDFIEVTDHIEATCRVEN
jgi:hypothetical protein